VRGKGRIEGREGRSSLVTHSDSARQRSRQRSAAQHDEAAATAGPCGTRGHLRAYAWCCDSQPAMTLKPELASDCTASALPVAAAAASSSERYTTHASPSSATRPAATQSLRRDPAAADPDELCGGGGTNAQTVHAYTEHTSSVRLHEHAIENILPFARSPSQPTPWAGWRPSR